MTEGRRNGGEMRVGGRGVGGEGGSRKGEAEHMWKTLQRGSRHIVVLHGAFC